MSYFKPKVSPTKEELLMSLC
ncbi:unnamed protein product [Linum tenue]|uniref:Uncharacterized protein n=1 Tax=Linum tenue TaxID=586396 RepID=A0AAV0HAQ5_9ROSI|nr:unnamed protein product [Linum tenue]